ncbi:MAG: TIGR03668 family PPOX class F420-dependent oxidoreductase [Candidatus Rokuibacteriota bacterium]|jgi:PPOX class probable F420-dependent enzyme|nr:MAG: TIGR03668 family PPOX class F420-dependent oxidoreductase [Candidatus Rokubacteria bacterium]
MARRARAQLTKALADFVAWERVCRVATAGSSGVPHVVPVCHVLAGGKVYFASGDDARKVKNLQDNPRVTVTVDLYSDHWGTLKGVMIQGRARLIERGSRFRRIRDLLYRKYPQYPREAAISPTDSVVVEVTPTRVFSWGFD